MEDIKNPICKMDGCERKYYGLGFCRLHYDRYRIGNLSIDGKRIIKPKWKKICKIKGCKFKHCSRGFCEGHYSKFKRGVINSKGDVIENEEFLKDKEKCLVDGCTKKAYRNGFCWKHYVAVREGRLSEDGKSWLGVYSDRVYKNDKWMCKVEGCNREHDTHGFCYRHNHYYIRIKNIKFLRDRYFGGKEFVCKKCNREFSFFVMDMHHNGSVEKKGILSDYIKSDLSKYPEKIVEIDSCEWYCSRCHDAIHNPPDKRYEETCKRKDKGRRADEVMRVLIEKYGNICVDCGDNLKIREVQYHHRDQEQKEFDVSKMIKRFSIEKLTEEVAKCDVLCRNCHGLRHVNIKDYNSVVKYVD